MSKLYPLPTAHSDIQEIFEDVFWVQGSLIMAPGFQISRNMIIVREGDELTLISSVRLNEAGLKALEALGTVKNVIKLGAYHLGAHNGIDDGFYVNQYNAKLWALPHMTHGPDLHSDHLLTEGGELPFSAASLIQYETSSMPEAMILLERDAGILITADSLQNWAQADEYFSEVAAEKMQSLGFIKPANVGPEWRRVCEPKASDFVKVLQLRFKHLMPSHGTPVINTAKQQYAATFKALFNI